MKKFEIKKENTGSWVVSHNEMPKLTCRFEDRKFHYSRTITGISNPTGDPKEIQLLQRMALRCHMDKING